MFGTTLMFGQAHGVIGAPAAATATRSVTDVEGLDGLHAEWGPFTAARENACSEIFAVFAVSSHTTSAKALRVHVVSGAAPPMMRLRRAKS